jgi:endonuclease YncB( thermonuclease family)
MPARADYFESRDYQQLVQKIKPLLREDFSQNIADFNAVRLKNYWQVGQRLIRLQKQIPEFNSLSQNSPPLQRLAKDLQVGAPTLYRILLFYRTWPKAVPIPPKQTPLTWAHHFELLSIDNEKARRYYHDQALQLGWKRNTLRQAIRLKLFEQTQVTGQHGQIPETKSPFYTYTAQVLRVLDGDTLKVKVDLGFHLNFEPILRLRGINTPELDNDPTGRALEAKIRLETLLSQQDFFVIKSYKTDVYGRFLVDIYYHPTLKEKEAILKQGIFLNQQLLDEGLGDWMVM